MEKREYYDNGQLKEVCNWENGVFEGKCKWYYENGELKAVSNYKNDKLEGECRWYYKNGELGEIYYFKKGIVITKEVLAKRELLEMIKEL
jgi:antitoxin component YwqK of YwqJK toxin-antitoxin module